VQLASFIGQLSQKETNIYERRRRKRRLAYTWMCAWLSAPLYERLCTLALLLAKRSK